MDGNASLSESLRQRLINAESDFLAAKDEDALEAFSLSWASLCGDVDQALKEGAVDDDLKTLVQSVFFRIVVLGDSLLQLHQETSSLTSGYLDEVEDILAQMSLEEPQQYNTPHTPASTRKEHHRGVIPASPSQLPPFIPSAYAWLLDNLCNPYPPSDVKKSLAKGGGMSLRAINDWFKMIRRRMGWVAICKAHFRGSRSLAVAAAGLVFSETSSELNLPFEVAADFYGMKSRLENLYCSERDSTWPSPSSSHSSLTDTILANSAISVTTKPSSVFHFDPPATYLPEASSGLTYRNQTPPLVFTPLDSDEEDRISDFSQLPLDHVDVWTEDRESDLRYLDARPPTERLYVCLEPC